MSHDDSREQGVELGALEDELESHEYPTTADELVAEYGDREIDLPNGSETVEEVLGPLADEEFGDAESVRQAVFNMVGSEAVGRQGYTDRGGQTGEADDEQESF